MAAKGQAKTGGRRKGTPNKLNADVKAMILAALDKVGGEEYLVRQAETNPTAFMTLLGKILPTMINATTKREVAEYTDDELRAILAAGEGKQPSVH